VTGSSWHPFETGGTLGHPGSEQGTIVRDEEHALGARITLERDTQSAPFAITCGIYGWMLHTRFFATEDETNAQYEQMKGALSALLDAAEETAEIDGGRDALFSGIDEFIGDYS
jgi:hypothetical protein